MNRITLFFCISLILTGCISSQDELRTTEVNRSKENDSFTIEEAVLFFADQQSLFTKSYNRKSISFFKRTNFIPIWEKAYYSNNSDLFYIEVPVTTPESHYAVFFDGLYYRLSECHHSLTFVKERKTGNIWIYNHFFLPLMSCKKSSSLFKETFYNGFHITKNKNGFSGFEIFSDLQGRIVTFNSYNEGNRVNHLFALESDLAEQTIIKVLKTTVALYFFDISDTKSDYVCPICGNDSFWEDELLGLICTECGFFAFYEGELEESQIYGEYTGGNSTGNNENGNGEPIDPEGPGIFPPNPDPEPGYGGNPSLDGPSIDYEHLLSTAYDGNPNIVLRFPDTLDTSLIASLRDSITATLDSLYSDPQTQSLMDMLSSLNISLIYNPDINHQAQTYRDSRLILWRVYTQPVITEELFHIFQHQNVSFRNLHISNYEFEAKCYLVSVYSSSRLTNQFGSLTSFVWNNAINYLSSRTQTNLENLSTSIQFAMGYDMSTLTILSDMLPNMAMLDMGVY